MRVQVKVLGMILLLLRSVVATAEPDVLSAIPDDAYGFAAVKSPQGIVDQLKVLMPFAEQADAEFFEDPLAEIREVLGDVGFAGPAAVVLLDLEKFGDEEPPVAFLLSATDAKAFLQSHIDKAQPSEEQLPDGVVKVVMQGEEFDLYLAVKDEFLVVAFESSMTAALANGRGSFEILPEVREAYDQGKIVALGDIQRMQPWMTAKIEQERADILAQVEGQSEVAKPDSIKQREAKLLFLELGESLAEQLDKCIYTLDVSATGMFYGQKMIFKVGSPAAKFVNAHIGQGEPSYRSIPAGAFILAGASKIFPQQLDVLLDAVLAKAKNYPSLQEKLDEEKVQELITDIRAFYGQFSEMAFTGNMGSPATGMVSLVVRFDVADAAAFKEQIKTACRNGFAYKLLADQGLQLVYTDAAESYATVDIDTIRLDFASSDASESEPAVSETANKVMQAMPMVLGPDRSIRIVAPMDNQVLIVVGGGYARAERVINVANGHGSSLADYPKVSKIRVAMPANRLGELHEDFGTILGAMKTFSPGMAGAFDGLDIANLAPVSVSYSVEPNSLRADGDLSVLAPLVAIFVPALQRARGEANRVVCMTNLKGCDTALYLYANSHGNKYPDPARWKEILIEEDLITSRSFICPSVGGDPETENDYVFVPWPGPEDVDGDLLILFESKTNHYGHRNVVNGAHGVQKVSEAEFQEMLAKTVEALKAKGIEFDWQESK